MFSEDWNIVLRFSWAGNNFYRTEISHIMLNARCNHIEFVTLVDHLQLLLLYPWLWSICHILPAYREYAHGHPCRGLDCRLRKDLSMWGNQQELLRDVLATYITVILCLKALVIHRKLKLQGSCYTSLLKEILCSISSSCWAENFLK